LKSCLSQLDGIAFLSEYCSGTASFAVDLVVTRGNQIRAAHLLGLNRNTLRKKIRDLGLEVIRGLKAD
jgi:DNA-binding protein Fis